MANPSGENVTDPPTVARLHTTLDSLTTASSILQGFAHRNKNQHRGTRWWGPFSMLSRSIRKLLPDLEGAVQRAEVVSSSSSSFKRRKIDKDGKSVGARQPELDKFAERAQWVHDVAVVKAYEAFTQLTADRQFAQLGLVLIGVLAQVEAVIAPFVEDKTEALSSAALSHTAKVAKNPDATIPESTAAVETDAGDFDLGVAISRDEIDHDDVDDDQTLCVEQPLSHLKKRKTTSLPQEDSEPAGKTKKDGGRKKTKATEKPSKSEAGEKKQPAELKHVPKVKQKKKKKKGGDEFDDLFSSLL